MLQFDNDIIMQIKRGENINININMATNTDEDDNYVCSLDEASKERARKELNEDEKNKDGAVQALRDWIKQQPWLKSPTDTKFLLRYLRCHKFSQLESRRVLENYWTIRSKHPELFDNLDPRDPNLQEILSWGFLVKLPRVDKDGRIYLLQRSGVVNIKRILEMGLENFMRTSMLIEDIIAMDERAQVNGVVLIGDFSDVKLQHTAQLYTIENTKILMSSLEGVLPIRVKYLNCFNVSPLMEAIMVFAKAVVKQKLRDRMHLHGRSLVSLYKEIDMSVLPTEYLPDDYTGPSSGSLQSIIDNFKAEIIKPEVVDHIRTLTTSGYGVDTKLKPSDVPNESFIKLNVD